jgi:phosphoribosylaminoimidazolecarboxamide formyltransferase / IMP cyclohydrolase
VEKKIKSALLSVYYKDGLEEIVHLLEAQGVHIYSTGGTQKFVEDLGVKVTPIESLTGYPSILGGRVKTLHPKVFGGILNRREVASDHEEITKFEIPEIDLVIVDLYPFEATVKSGASEAEIIEKIDIGGVSLIRAAAKNFNDVVIVAAKEEYAKLAEILKSSNGSTSIEDRKYFAAKAFGVTSHYDTNIFNYFNQSFQFPVYKESITQSQVLRYGENPHQTGVFYGNLDELFDKLNGKELSYNNLVDLDASLALLDDFEETSPTFVIIKHTNACGIAVAKTSVEAYTKALACDPISAFGGVIATNQPVDKATAVLLNDLFFEILTAPDYDKDALDILSTKKNRIVLKRKVVEFPNKQIKTILNGILVQDKDNKVETSADLRVVTKKAPTASEVDTLLFANKLVKHTKSNTIILAKDSQFLASGVGQTSRVDALKQAIEKARAFGFDINGAVMASDAFFPFADCVEIAHDNGIISVIQPGGSVRDKDSIVYCDEHNMSMVFTGIRHFKH